MVLRAPSAQSSAIIPDDIIIINPTETTTESVVCCLGLLLYANLRSSHYTAEFPKELLGNYFPVFIFMRLLNRDKPPSLSRLKSLGHDFKVGYPQSSVLVILVKNLPFNFIWLFAPYYVEKKHCLPRNNFCRHYQH